MELFLLQRMTGLLTLDNISRNCPNLRVSITLDSIKNIPEQKNKNKNKNKLKKKLPDIVKPQGISREWADYLHNEIREFCREGTENLVAPRVS